MQFRETLDATGIRQDLVRHRHGTVPEAAVANEDREEFIVAERARPVTFELLAGPIGWQDFMHAHHIAIPAALARCAILANA